MRNAWPVLVVLMLPYLLLGACGQEHPADSYDPAHDYFSFANTREFSTRHLELDLEVDFAATELRGSVVLHMNRIAPAARKVVLDSHGLVIGAVQLLQADGDALDLDYQLGETDPVKGEPLVIDLPDDFAPPGEFRLRIQYHTGPNAAALMWLPAGLTAGGAHPFMFTQSESIHARSWVPLQDTPGMRITYEAEIHTPPQLLAVMSADNNPAAGEPGAQRNGDYHFSMPQPIPSYLLALAVGNLFFAPLGPDTGVYAEPEVLPAAAWEFADTQNMLDAAEATYGPYRWGRYDLLILPPSFPFGGMENPRLSFITPSLLAGDRSLVSVIAHELAHSWSGNLVSNNTWRDIWLNEGTTSYVEARLMEVLYGKERSDEERLLSYQDLQESLATVPSEMQALAPVFSQGDPDVGQGTLHYSKGALFLENLEALFGREVFDAYLAGYFNHFAMQSISSEQFLDYIDTKLLQQHPGIYSRKQVEEWLYQPGIPASALVPTSASLDGAAAAARNWSSGELPSSELPFATWSPQAAVYFIKALPPQLSDGQLTELDELLGLSQSRNAEIARTWFTQVAARRHLPAYEAMRAYLGRYGRTRLIEPVYAALVANGQDLEWAKTTFNELRDTYHPLTVTRIEHLFAPK